MLLSAANVFFRDIQYIYNAMTTAWMYLTPIFYPIDQLPEGLRWGISTFNPMFFYISQFRDSERIDNLREYFVKLMKRELMFKEFLALQDINLQVIRGESLSPIGGVSKPTEV